MMVGVCMAWGGIGLYNSCSHDSAQRAFSSLTLARVLVAESQGQEEQAKQICRDPPDQ